MLEDLLAERLRELRVGLARVRRAHVGDVHHDAQELEVVVVVLLRLLDHLERAVDALQGEVLGLGADQRPVGGDEPVDRQQPERRRAVDQDHVVGLARVLERLLEHQLPAHLAGQGALDLGEVQRRGDDPVVGRLLDLGVAGQDVGHARRGVRRDVEVVREVPLRVQIDGQHLEPDAPEHVGEGADGRGLARAALERQDRDRVGHTGRHDTEALSRSIRPKRRVREPRWCP